MKKKVLSLLAVFVFAISFGTNAGASMVYDLADDFSLASNPNGAWTYGAYSGGLNPGSFYEFITPVVGSFVGLDDLTSLRVWTDADGGDPNIIKNVGADFTTINFDQITFHADEVTFGPYLGPTVARWTAPSDGTFQLDLTFATVQAGNTAPNAYFFDGTTLMNLGLVPDFNVDILEYHQTLTVSAGQTLDFIVWGNNTANKTTEVSATLTPVPEPSTLLLLGSGLAGLAWFGRKRGS